MFKFDLSKIFVQMSYIFFNRYYIIIVVSFSVHCITQILKTSITEMAYIYMSLRCNTGYK